MYWKTKSWIAVALLFGSATAAEAQSLKASRVSMVVDAAVPEIPAEAPDSVPAVPAESETPAEAEKEKEAASIEVGIGTVKFGGLIQAWYSAGTGDDINTFRLRRAELKFAGAINPSAKWTIMVDPAKALKVSNRFADVGDTRVVTGGEVSQSSLLLQDALVTLSFLGLELDAGQFKLPLGLEGGPQSSGALETVERNLFVSRGKLGSARDLGMMLSGSPAGPVELSLGLFNSAGEGQNSVDGNDAKVVSGRAALRTPVEGLRLGTSGAWSGRDAAGRTDRLGADLVFARGPLLLKGEVMRATDGSTRKQGYYGHAGYRVGKLEGVVRYDVWDADLGAEASAADVTERDYLAGVNYYVSGSNVKLQANYLHRSFGAMLPSRGQLLFNVQTSW